MADYFIVMGDVIKSRLYPSEQLVPEFKDMVGSCNRNLSSGILSPYTITLGDEFQGAAKSLHWAVQTLLYLERLNLKTATAFALRFVVHYGRIDTRLNTEIAYGMVGPGLARARQLLTEKRRPSPRFLFDLPDQGLAQQLNRLFGVLASLSRDWHGKDSGLIADMLDSADNGLIGEKHGKNRSQIWKRRKTLRVDDYRAISEVILALSETEQTG